MSSPAWLSKPAPTPTPSAPPPVPDSVWAKQKIALCRSLIHDLRTRSEERGDAADEAATLTHAWLDALLDHPKHGRNWFAKHGADLAALLRPFFPTALGPVPEPAPVEVIHNEDVVEGEALEFVVKAIFPDAAQASEMDVYYRKRPFRGKATLVDRMPTAADVAPRARARELEPERGLF